VSGIGVADLFAPEDLLENTPPFRFVARLRGTFSDQIQAHYFSPLSPQAGQIVCRDADCPERADDRFIQHHPKWFRSEFPAVDTLSARSAGRGDDPGVDASWRAGTLLWGWRLARFKPRMTAFDSTAGVGCRREKQKNTRNELDDLKRAASVEPPTEGLRRG
jgi:hypothetical protein